MSVQEEKEWLRAILEGRVKPGDVEWEKVCLDDDFAGLRKRLHEIDLRALSNRAEDLKAIWRNIEQMREERLALRRRRVVRRLFYGAASMALVVALSAVFLMRREKPVSQVSSLPAELAWGQMPVLVLPNGEKRVLPQNDTAVCWQGQGGDIRIDSRTLIMNGDVQSKEAEEPVYYTMNIPYGGEYSLVLPDGTKIYLNAGTSLRYPNHFCGDSREIFLSGEAYLEVARDEEKPFIVRTSEVDIRVLGTVFNINAYPDGEYVRTTLVTGKVEARCGEERILMEPGMQVAYNKAMRQADYFPVDVHLFTSWKDGYYDFEEMSLGELMQVLSRWYDVKVEFAEPDLKKLKFSGRFKRYEDVGLLFKRLEYTKDVTFTNEDGCYVVRGKNNRLKT